MKNKLIVIGLLLIIAAAGVKMGYDAWLPKWRTGRAMRAVAGAAQAKRGEGAASRNVWQAGRYPKSDITFTPVRWVLLPGSGTIDNGTATRQDGTLFLHFQGILAKPSGTATALRIVLYKSASLAGPFRQANAVTRPQQRSDPETYLQIADDHLASLGGNWVYYKLVLFDATNRLIADFPPFRLPLIPPPKVRNNRLEWKPYDPAGEMPEGSLAVLATANNVCLERAPLAASVSVPLPAAVPVTSVVMHTVWPENIDPTTGAWRYTFANQRYAFSWPSSAARTALNQVVVKPVMSLDGKLPDYFQFYPKRAAFDAIRYHWDDAPGVTFGEEEPMAPVRSIRRLIVEFQVRGSGRKGRATCTVLPRPGVGNVILGDRRITAIFSRPELTAFWKAMVQPPGCLALTRGDHREVAHSSAPVETLADTEAENGKDYGYSTEFRDAYTTGTAWAADQGEFPVLAPVEGSLIDSMRYRMDPAHATLNIAVLPSELCFEKTEYPAIYTLNRVIRSLLTDARVHVLDRSVLDEMLDEMTRAAAGTGKVEMRIAKPQYVLRLADFTRLEGNGIALWLTDVAADYPSHRSIRIGELMCPVKTDLAAAVDRAFVQPLAEFLKPRLASFGTPQAAAVEIKTLIFGALVPAAQDSWFQDSDAMADDFAVTTAQALPQKRILARRELAALLQERSRRQGQGGGQDELSTGQALISGRIWWANPERVGYFLLATDLADGRIVDTLFVPEETDASRAAIATWCAQMKTLPPPPAATAPQAVYTITELRFKPLNPYWMDPAHEDVGGAVHSFAATPTGAAGLIEVAASDAEVLRAHGDTPGAMAKMEDLWFRRENYSLADENVVTALLRAGTTLAQWYHADGEFASEADIWKWVLEKNLNTGPKLSVTEVKNRYMRARYLARDQPTRQAPEAAPLPGASPTRNVPGVASYLLRWTWSMRTAYERPVQLFQVAPDGTEKEIKVPYVFFGLPLPNRLAQAAEGDPMEPNFQQAHYPSRPVIGPEAPFFFSDYLEAFFDYLRADQDVFAKGIQAVQTMRLDQQQGKVLLLKGAYLASTRGRVLHQLVFPGRTGEPLPDYYEITAESFMRWLREAPYTMSEVIRKLPETERARLLPRMLDAAQLQQAATDNSFLDAMGAGTFFVYKWGAESGNATAIKVCAAVRARAAAQLQSVDLTRSEGRSSDYVYLLLMDNDPTVRDWLRDDKNLAATIRRTWHGNDLVRYLLDHGYPNAMRVALANRPVQGFYITTFLWRSRQELNDSVNRDVTLYDAEEVRRLMSVLGRPDDEIQLAVARARKKPEEP